MVNGTWYTRPTSVRNSWVVKQFGGEFLRDEDGEISRFTASEAQILVVSLNKGVTL